MQEYILNLLPVKEEEKREFEAIAPRAVHAYARSSTVTTEQLAAATILFGWPRPERMGEAVRLKWFQTMFAGAEAYQAEGVLPPGVWLTTSSGANSLGVAEHMLAGLLAVCQRLPLYRDNQKAHLWKAEGNMRTIIGGTVLVVGAGHIGTAFAGLCRSLGANTIGLKRRVDGPVAGFDRVLPMEQLDGLLPQADVVALTLPHTPETVGLMNEARIARMKDDAILLNAGRGSVLDQAALARAMAGGKLWGAALDVAEPEPLPPDSPLWDIPNLLITPHVAGGIRLERTRRACIQMALDNLRRYLAGEPLENRVR